MIEKIKKEESSVKANVCELDAVEEGMDTVINTTSYSNYDNNP